MFTFRNREHLLEYLDRHIIGNGGDYWLCYQPCGEIVRFKSREDIPGEDMPCPCGDSDCWVFQYAKSGG
jgi:hypothetical protein